MTGKPGNFTIKKRSKSMANLQLLLTFAVLCGCCACISAQGSQCPLLPSSCQEAYLKEKCSGKTPADGEYTIVYWSDGNLVAREVYCDMTLTNCGSQGWMRVAELDMTVQGSKCPDGLDQGTYGNKTLCGNRGANTCRSTTFNTFGFPYTEVCGFVAGYQYKTPDAFRGKTASIDSVYLDGISITHGTSPRNHI